MTNSRHYSHLTVTKSIRSVMISSGELILDCKILAQKEDPSFVNCEQDLGR